MLIERFVAASLAPPSLTASSANSNLLKDAGIFLHTLQPQPALKSTFARSRANTNCIALSPSHIYAGQDGKAVVHIYNRAKGNHEATVPLPSKIHAIALAAQDSILAAGLGDGSILLWELQTGRLTQTPPLHLQPVRSLLADPSSNWLISASADSTVLIWALADLLALSSSSRDTESPHQPRHTLTAHRAAITALALGHSRGTRNLLASASRDKTIILWDLHLGTQLRTYLVPSVPQALAFDPADRALFAAYDDGRVQVLDLMHDYPAVSSSATQPTARPASASALTPSSTITPVQPPPVTFLRSPTPEPDVALCLAVSYDATTLVTGHASGSIRSWSVAERRFASTLAEYPSAPITNLVSLPPSGFPHPLLDTDSGFVKPKVHEAFSGARGVLTASYALHAQLTGRSKAPARVSRSPPRQRHGSEFETALWSVGLPSDLLSTSLAFPTSAEAAVDQGASRDGDGDNFMRLDGGSAPKSEETEKEVRELRHANRFLMRILGEMQEERNAMGLGALPSGIEPVAEDVDADDMQTNGYQAPSADEDEGDEMEVVEGSSGDRAEETENGDDDGDDDEQQPSPPPPPQPSEQPGSTTAKRARRRLPRHTFKDASVAAKQ